MERAVDTPYEVFTRDDAYQAGIDHLITFAGMPPGQVVMDLGGGTGAMSVAVLERCEPAELIVVDPDETGLAAARAALGDRARYLLATAECLDEHVPPGSVDHVVVANAIHLFEDLLEELPDPSPGLLRGHGPDARREEVAGGLLRETSPVAVPRVDDQSPCP